METRIVNTFKETKGSLKTKCLSICKEFGFIYELMPKGIIKNGKNKNGETDGYEIRTTGLKDKFDLFDFLHELGHCLLHYAKNLTEIEYLTNTQKYEDEANEFAEKIMVLIYGNSIKNITLACKL